MLYIVATPIGNLKDITLRALEVLKEVDIILAEDTRMTKKLLTNFSISTKMESYHNFNEDNKINTVLNYLAQGIKIALVSDAGTPLICDPGYTLVVAARKAGYDTVPIPGASALITALCASGLPTDEFQFKGFIPAKSNNKKDFLLDVLNGKMTTICYESVHRIVSTSQVIVDVMGENQQVVLAKELTKQFEYFFSGTALELKNWIENNSDKIRGEFVLLFKGQIKSTKLNYAEDVDLNIKLNTLLKIFLEYMPIKKAIKEIGKFVDIKNEHKADIYNLAVEIKNDK